MAFPLVTAGKWAWEDLNLRPHPYQLNAGNRCANRPFPRSRPTVRAKGMRSISSLVCVQFRTPERPIKLYSGGGLGVPSDSDYSRIGQRDRRATRACDADVWRESRADQPRSSVAATVKAILRVASWLLRSSSALRRGAPINSHLFMRTAVQGGVLGPLCAGDARK